MKCLPKLKGTPSKMELHFKEKHLTADDDNEDKEDEEEKYE